MEYDTENSCDDPRNSYYQDPSLIFFPGINVRLCSNGAIKLITCGIPRFNSVGVLDDYYPNDDKREFTKISLDKENKACQELRKTIQAIDIWIETKKIKKILSYSPSKKKNTSVKSSKKNYFHGKNKVRNRHKLFESKRCNKLVNFPKHCYHANRK